MLFWTGTLIFVVSFVFAMLGLGGGMLYVPIFHWLGFGLKNVVIPLGLLLNGLNTLVALVPYGRKGLVDWKGGLPMALGALVGAPLGAMTAPYVPGRVLLILFALLVLVAGARTLAVVRQAEPALDVLPPHRMLWGTLVSTLAGFLGGMLGIGGGFLISPLLLWIGYPTKEAAATTAYIVTFSSFSGFLGHMGHMTLSGPLLAVTVGAVLVASWVGSSFMANKAKPAWVKTLYGILLLGVAAKLLWPFLATA
ncbi:MAG: sulfite exporter TauE/SafE family protein [Firmicutes bacterium]|nr:sulfite exporter TauE/SafE family protein [Bacillota bacterium]